MESFDIVVYVDDQRMLRSDCTDVHTDLSLRCSQMTSESFSQGVYHMTAIAFNVCLTATDRAIGQWL